MNEAVEIASAANEIARLAKLTKLNNLHRLDTAIHRLTQPHITRVMQRAAGGGRRETTLNHSALIDMLITASTTKSGSSTSSSSVSGMVINAVAFQKIEDLKKQARASWLTLLPGGELLIDSFQYKLSGSLHLWHSTFVARYERRLVSPLMLADAAARYVGWMNLIDLMFEPQPVSDFIGSCPQCHSEYLINTDGDRVRAITISFKTVLATCRNCGETWAGPGDFIRLNNGHGPHDTP